MNKKTFYRTVAVSCLAVSLSSCSFSSKPANNNQALAKRYLPSGTIVLSQSLGQNSFSVASNSDVKNVPFAPLHGYFPKANATPSVNEVWLEVNKSTKQIALYKGMLPVVITNYEGSLRNENAEFVRRLVAEPTWEASDKYFFKRNLAAPLYSNDRQLKGALGSLALELSDGTLIHNAPVWDEEVQGLKVDTTSMEALAKSITPGIRIIIR